MTEPCEGPAATRERPRVGDVVRAFLGPLRESHTLTNRQDTVIGRIARCQTAAMGGHVMKCAHCGERVPMYNSCRDRHCPQCGWGQQLKWMEARQERILPVPYFHTVFTLPEQLRPLLAANPDVLYALLFRAVARTLATCAADPKRLGALPGYTLVLHTWDRQLQYHPHIHGVVTAGGLTSDGHWKGTTRPGRKSFLFHVRVMGELFRGSFLSGLIAHLVAGELSVPDAITHDVLDRIRAAARTNWNVYAKRPFAGAEQVYRYLGRYTHRVGISNSRIIAIAQDDVRFHTKDGKAVCIPGTEFVRRLAQHVLPTGFTRIRHYGLLAPAHVNTTWRIAYEQLAPTQPVPPETNAAAALQEHDGEPVEERWHPPVCPSCGLPALILCDAEPPPAFDSS